MLSCTALILTTQLSPKKELKTSKWKEYDRTLIKLKVRFEFISSWCSQEMLKWQRQKPGYFLRFCWSSCHEFYRLLLKGKLDSLKTLQKMRCPNNSPGRSLLK